MCFKNSISKYYTTLIEPERDQSPVSSFVARGIIPLRPKLPQHPQIILKQQPDIVNLIPQQHCPVNAHTKSIA